MFVPDTAALHEDMVSIVELRAAIHANRVNFPVPVPVFKWQHKAEVQWRLAELYFVHGWSPARLADRYHITSSRVRQTLRAWAQRAKDSGYLQTVPSEQEISFGLARAAYAGQSPPELIPAHLTGLLTPQPQTLHTHA